MDPVTTLAGTDVVPLPRRLTPRPRRPAFTGRVLAIDTEGSTATNTYTATVRGDDVDAQRFTDPHAFADFLIAYFAKPGRVLAYCHNLEWDLQVLWLWLRDTRLRYVRHSARRNGSALCATFDHDQRYKGRSPVVIRDSFAIYPMSLSDLGRVVGIAKLRTPAVYMPKLINYETGEEIDNHSYEDETDAVCAHGRAECTDCYDLRDVEILHAAMRLYVAECDAAGVRPAYTRSAHAMADFRTNYLPEALVQYTETQNARAALARYGGRVQMLQRGLVTCEDEQVIVQADVTSQYPSVMVAGQFPDADHHHVLHHPAADRVREYTGIAWADVTIPAMTLGPIIYRHPLTGRISYPTDCRLQGAWTTDELAYVLDIGGHISEIVRLEGTPTELCIDPFSTFIHDKFRLRADQKANGNAMQEATKLTMNGLSGKFGMRWMQERLEFVAASEDGQDEWLPPPMCTRKPAPPVRYPEYIMMSWSALIMARGRLMLHAMGMRLEQLGARLLCCDTDSWTFQASVQWFNQHAGMFGKGLGAWALEERPSTPATNATDNGPQSGHSIGCASVQTADILPCLRETAYHAFRGTAPKEYALYADNAALFSGHPTKGRAKGVSADGGSHMRMRAVDHYLRGGTVHFSRPSKTLGVLRGAPAATFQPLHKASLPRVEADAPHIFMDFRAHVRAQIAEAEANTLFMQRMAQCPGHSALQKKTSAVEKDTADAV